MPALTVKAVTKALSDYVRPDEDIVAKLNMVMPRIYAMGMWRDLLYDWSIETTNDYFALPEHSESLLGAMLQNSPVETQSQWHDYRISGYASDGPSPIFGVVDDGFHSTIEELRTPTTADVYEIVVRAISPSVSLPSDGEIVVESTRLNGTKVRNSVDFSSYGAGWSDATITEVNSISFSDIHDGVEVYASNKNDDSEIILARIKGDGVARYRRFRFHNSDSSPKNVKLLLKRAWQPVLTQDDILHLGNLNAIKHGLLGMLAEDNADLERAQYHWTICRQLLDEELDAARGAAKPKLTVKPAGNNFHIPNII
jgi:hypothetical protein